METGLPLSFYSNFFRTPSRFDRHQDRPILHALLKKRKHPNLNPNKQENPNEERIEKQYRCRSCNTAVALVGDEVSVGEIPVETMQINPHGYIHEIFTVRSAFHVLISGNPVPADSWFPGYMWRFCLCAQCHHHLGWSYQPYDQNTIVFFGLRRGSVKED